MKPTPFANGIDWKLCLRPLRVLAAARWLNQVPAYADPRSTGNQPFDHTYAKLPIFDEIERWPI
jgi:hypothetical protein